MSITVQQLKTALPKISDANANAVADPLNGAMALYAIFEPLSQACFLANCAHESGLFVFMKEIWGPTEAQKKYDPPNAKAKELGNTAIGDGKKYMGRGPIQLTGKSNYQLFSNACGIDYVTNPELLENVSVGCQASAWFWNANGILQYSDVGDILSASRIVNLGSAKSKATPNGYAERLAYFNSFKTVLGA